MLSRLVDQPLLPEEWVMFIEESVENGTNVLRNNPWLREGVLRLLSSLPTTLEAYPLGEERLRERVEKVGEEGACEA